MKSKKIYFVIAIVMIISAISIFSFISSAEENATVLYSGTCGEALTWTLDESGILVISGTGDMYDYVSSDPPFYKYRSSVKILIVGEGVTSIGQNAFKSFSSLESINLPDSIKKIGRHAFYNTAYYKNSFNWDNGILYIDDFLIASDVIISGNHSIREGTKVISDYAFYNCTKLNNINIPDGVTVIGKYAFYKCSNLENITIPSSVSVISQYAFFSCTSLKNVLIMNGVTSIEKYAFHSCESITSLYIPGSVRTIGYCSFYLCSSIIEVKLAKGVTAIDTNAFYQCTALKAVYIPKSVNSFGNSVFPSNNRVTFYCVSGSAADRYLNKVAGLNIVYVEDPVCDNCVFTKYVSDNNGTCIADGTMTAYCDNGCGSRSTIVEKNSKRHNYMLNITVDPTCINNGRGMYVCDLCKDSYTQILPPVSHSFKDYEYNGDASCTADGTQTAYCSFGCGSSDTVTKSGSALGHGFEEYIYNKDASCLTDGTKTAKCIRCDVTDTVSAEGTALGHSFSEYQSDGNATCTADGTETSICVRCNEQLTRIEEGSALGHSFVDYTNDNNADCTHDATETALCANGCGISDTRIVEGSALGHAFIEYLYDNNATCIENGTETALCANGCGVCDSRIAENSALGHSFTEYVIISELSCTVNGQKEALCDNGCGSKDIIKEEAKGHIHSEWIVTEEPDYYYEGCRIQNCTVCSEVLKTEPIPVLIYEGFPDIWGASWYAEGIEYCFKHGYILGTDKGLFKPNGTLTREQFVVILARVSGAKLSEYTESIFDDVDSSAWYASSVIWANAEGLVNGIGNGNFGIGHPVTREVLATILYRYAQKQGIDTAKKADLAYCNDAKQISSWALDACAWAIKVNLLGSTSETSNILSPKMTVTRAQAAKIFMSYDSIY